MKQTKDKGFQYFFALWTGEFISAIGSGLTSFGLGIYVYQLTGKASTMALVTLLGFLPSLLLSTPAGVLADRYDRRVLMLLGDSLSAIGIVLILFSVCFNFVNLPIICIGVTISSVFSSLMEPAYKATVSDLLKEEDYAKASGMVQIASSSKYLIAPIIAGFLLGLADIKLLMIIDICTFFVTVVTNTIVRKGIKLQGMAGVKTKSVADATDTLQNDEIELKKSFLGEIKVSFSYLKNQKGIFILVLVTACITFFMGFIQTLSTPMILAFSNETTLGTIESIIASGMLVSSVVIGMLKVKKGYLTMLVAGLVANGTALFLFGLRESIVYIGITGFLFFLTLPFANTGIECLIRKNLDRNVEGRVWGMIGTISQLGYVFAYAFCGLLADYVFTPLLRENGVLADSLGKLYGVGEGRGCALLISVSGLAIILLAIVLPLFKSVRKLE